ncbi:MAG TPA: hypothetical protein PKM59_01940 [Thermodesulfobacteriota bacterium]|nr:hypothetical protein [Thermodesulfobacteriota bacterium]
MNKRSIKLLTMLLVIWVFFAGVADAQAAYSVKEAFLRISGTAGETLATGDVVCIKDADGYVYKADANDAALRPAVGIVGSKDGASGASVEIVVQGVLTGWSALSEGVAGYLSETAAAVTQSAPSYSQQLGFAISATDYFFSVQSYVDTSAITSLGVLSGTTPIIVEGSTVDDNETTLTFADPTADRAPVIPDAVSGTIYATSVTAHATTGNITAAECWGGTVTNTGAGGAIVLTLPDAVAGMQVLVVLLAAQDVDINPQNAEQILTATDAAGDAISSAATIGNFALLKAVSATQWIVQSSSGTWTDVN